MKTQAAILRSAPGKYEVAEVELEEPRHGEVLVKLVAAGLCHSDDHIATGDLPLPRYPIAGGHEGAGVVQQVGPGVDDLAPGDHVVFSFIPACGWCRFCARGQQNLCELGAFLLLGSRPRDPESFRLTLDGSPVGQMGGISTFSQYTTADIASCVKIPKDMPLDKACLLGCGVGTGWGSAIKSAGVQVGDIVIVMGTGGIGINAVQGASHAGAREVIAVDPVAFKRETAAALGATRTVETIDEAAELAREFSSGQGADSVIVAVGVTTGEHLGQAFSAVRKGGTVVATGIGDMSEIGIPVSLTELTLFQKRIQGSLYGECAPREDIPRQLELYQAGRLKLDELVTNTYSLDQISQGYEDMHAGKNIRGVILFD